MKFNEPVKPKGIGRNQVAFNLPLTGQLIDLVQQSELDNPQEVNLQEAVSKAVSMSRVIAYSAASSAIANNYAEPFGLAGLENFTINHAGAQNWSNATVRFELDSYSKYAPENPNYFLSSDGLTINVNRSGWYQISAMLYIGDHAGNHVYMLKAYPEEQFDETLHGGDYLETQDHPTLRLTQLVPIVGFDNFRENNGQNVGGIETGGFKLELFIYGLTNNITITSGNSEIWLQAIWLGPLRNSTTINPA